MYVVFTHQKDIRPLMDISVYQLFEQIVRRTRGAQVHICTETCTDGIGNGYNAFCDSESQFID